MAEVKVNGGVSGWRVVAEWLQAIEPLIFMAYVTDWTSAEDMIN